MAVVSTGAKGFRNVYLIPAAGGAPRQVSFVANAESTNAAWSPDGSTLLFGSGQRTEDFELDRVDLKPRTPTFRTDQFSDLFRQRPTRQSPEPATPRQPSGDTDGAAATTTATTAIATTGPTTGPTTRPDHTEVVFDGIEQRLSLLPVGVNVDEVAISPDGKWAGVIGESGNHTNIYLYPLDALVESPVARQMTTTAGGKSDLQFAADPGGSGTRLYFREGGAIRHVPVPARATGGTGGGSGRDRRRGHGQLRDGRQLRPRQADRIRAGVAVPRGPVPRPVDARVGLARGAPDVRAAHGRRPHARRPAAAAVDDDRRAERIAPGDHGPRATRSARRSGIWG